MIRPIEVNPRPNYRLHLRYSNGAEGEVDVSHLVGRGVFKAWEDESFFLNARLTPYGAVAWGSEIELCGDALYLQLPRRSLAELIPGKSAASTSCLNWPGFMGS